MAASAANHTRLVEMVSLSALLKSLRDCNAALGLIWALEKQLEDAISPPTGGRASELPERSSSRDLKSTSRGVSAVGAKARGESAEMRRVDGIKSESTSGDDEEGGVAVLNPN